MRFAHTVRHACMLYTPPVPISDVVGIVTEWKKEMTTSEIYDLNMAIHF